MTPEQLAEIEQRWERWINPKSAPKTLGGDFLILLAEVRRLNRMVDKACELYADLQKSCPYDAHDFEPDGDCNETCKNEYADCWRKYLESEVAE